MAGCDKAGRNKKSKANEAYKGAKRWEINAKRKKVRMIKAVAKKSSRVTTPRGTARDALRKQCAAQFGELTPVTWKEFKRTHTAKTKHGVSNRVLQVEHIKQLS
jgi:hypothetical protein